MPARHGSRFALEAGFLILLAVLAGLADLRWQAIVLVMGIAWLLIALLEWAFWRDAPRLPPMPRGSAAWAPPIVEPTPPAPRPAAPPPPLLPPREDATRIIEPGQLAEPVEPPAPAELEPETEAPEREPEEPAGEAEPESESASGEPPPRRTWWWRRRESEAELEPVRPRHVRVLPSEEPEEE